MKRQRISRLLAGVLLFGSLFGQGCTNAPSAATAAASKRVELNVWGVVDDVDAYQEIFKDYRTLHPNITINYRRYRLEEYEDAVVNALAEDRGPDIFLIHNTWVTKYLPKIQPMPASTKVAVQQITGTIKKVTTYVLETHPTISISKYKSSYPDAVLKDTIRPVNVAADPSKTQIEQRIVALPMSVDTLSMYVNKDLLNAAGVATVPTTWSAFQTVIPRLTKQDAQGNLIQMGTALGTGYNVERSPDILAALMMQNGAVMSDDNGNPTFQAVPASLSGTRDEPPAYQALQFYTDFANPGKEVYTWNAKQINSLDAFVEGRVAFFFGYSYHLPVIRARAPKLNLGIAQLPQIEGNPTANFANYWAWTVSKKTKNADISWDLLNFMIGKDEAVKYLVAAKHPAADRSLLDAQLQDEDVGVFASQVLTAKSWYRGDDATAMEDAFKTMIENALAGTEEIPTAIQDAAQKVRQTIP